VISSSLFPVAATASPATRLPLLYDCPPSGTADGEDDCRRGPTGQRQSHPFSIARAYFVTPVRMMARDKSGG
jgi:hypothetical protein